MNTTPPSLVSALAMNRRSCLSAVLMLGVARIIHAAPDASLPIAKSLREELALALKGGNPLLVMVSLDACPFCKVARESYLSPMRAEQGLSIVQVNMHHAETVKDFKGVVLTQDELVHLWKVTLAPTVLFFGRDGAEVAPRLVGIGSPDFYGNKLDQRMEQARAAIKAP